jgi:hypothetical protein
MIEVIERWLVAVTHVDDADQRIRKIVGLGLAPHDRDRTDGEQNTAGEDLVFVGAARVRHEGVKSIHAKKPKVRTTEAMGRLCHHNLRRLVASAETSQFR